MAIDIIHAKTIIEKTAKHSGIQNVSVDLEDGYLNVKINGYDFSVYDNGEISAWQTIPSTWTEPEDYEETILGEALALTAWEAAITLFGCYFRIVVEDVADAESQEQYAKELNEFSDAKIENAINSLFGQEGE